VKQPYINNTHPETHAVAEFLERIFGGKIDFDLRKDWSISVAVKNDKNGVTSFAAKVKMTDANICGSQLDMFNEQAKQSELMSVAHEG